VTGYHSWAALEEVTAANLNGYVRDQVVSIFTNSAARSAAIGAAAPVGMQSYLTSTGSHEVYYGTTTGWAPPWAQPWGIMGLSTYSTSVAMTAANTYYEVGGGSNRVSFTGVTGRRYRVTGTFYLSNATASATVFNVKLRNGSTDVAVLAPQSIDAGRSGNYSFSIVTNYVGAQALNVVFASTVATGATAQVYNSFSTGYLDVMDIGSTTTPPAS